MNYNKVFIFISIWFISSIFIWNIYFDFRWIIIALITFLILSFLLILFLKKDNFLIIFLCFWYFIWSLYMIFNLNKYTLNKEFLDNFLDKKVEISATYKELYAKKPNYNQYVFVLNNIDNSNVKWINFLVNIPLNYKINYWDKITFESKISVIKNFNHFNYQKFLLTKNVYFNIFFINNLEIKVGNKNIILDKIFSFRQNLLFQINELFPKDEANFLAWVLIWYRQDLSEELSSAYNRTWLTHLIAVSGFNITILIIFFWFFVKILPFYFRPFVIVPIIIFFVILVWWNPAVLRAWIMWIIGYLILTFWREKNMLSIICLTLSIMLLISPYSLNYDYWFILSFLALIWILYLSNFYYKIFKFLPNFLAIRDSLVLTISALTTTFPVVFFWFWVFSIISPVTNLIVWWLIPFIMFSWFLSIIIYSVNNFIWYYFWYLTYFLIKFVNDVAIYFSSFSFSTVEYDFWKYWSYYMLLYIINLFFILFLINKKKPI